MSMYRVDPRIRAYGKARIDITRRAKDEQEWQRLWKEPRYPFPFELGTSWKSAFQYQVDDYAAEIGFLMDVLGLPVYSFSPSSATFTSPDQDFAFCVVAVPEGGQSTPPDTLRIQFMVKSIFEAVEELERRGIKFEQRPEKGPAQGYTLQTGFFRTPHGICIDLIGAGESMGEAASATAGLRAEAEPVENVLDEHPWQEAGVRQPLEAAPEEDPFAFLDEDSHPVDQQSATEEALFDFNLSTEEANPGENREPGPSLRLFEYPELGEPLPPGGLEPAPEADQSRQPRPSKGKKPRPAEPRRGDPFLRAGSARLSGGLRGSGAQRRPDLQRRSGGALRKNPFNPIDLSPLPDFTDRRPAASRQDKSPRPDPDDRPPAPRRFNAPDQPDEVESELETAAPAAPPEAEVEEQIKYEDIEEIEQPEDFDEFFS